MPILTVIVPCYNEAKRLDTFFSLIRENTSLDWEWLFVDDGSTDETVAVLKTFAESCSANVRVLENLKNRGKGASVAHGMREAEGELVGFVDADLAASPLAFADHLDDAKLRAGKKIVIGIRLKTHDGRVKRDFHRHLMGRVYQTLVSMATGLCVYDTQCGFKLLNRERAHDLGKALQCEGFSFDAELLMRCDRLGMTIEEVRIPWEEKGDSRIRARHILQMFFDIWRIRGRVRRGE